MTHAVVTGASTGIGRAIAYALASEGATVAIIGRNRAELEVTTKEIERLGGEALAVICDLRQTSQIAESAQTIRDQLATIDIVANVAGVWHDDERAFQGPLLHETATDEIADVLTVGIHAPMVLTAHLLPAMVSQKSGHVVNISGTFADGAAGWLHYYVAKKAIEDFTVGLAQELRSVEVQVNCICPADVATPAYSRFYPEYVADALNPTEVAEFFSELVSPPMRHVTGQIIELRNRKDHG